MSRTLLAILLAAPACLSAHGGPDVSTGSTGLVGSSTAPESTGDGSSSSGGDASSSSSGSGSIGDSDAGTTADASGTGTSAAGTDTSGTGTSGPGPFCGDGEVDPGEECDDGNIDQEDACNLICARRRIVFVTSVELQGDIGGLALADGLCRQLAGAAGLEHWKTFNAWLSDSTTSAAYRLFPGKGIYTRTDGVIVTRKAKDFVSGQLEAPISVDEKGTLVGASSVWTGTLPDGSAVPGAQHCDDWTSKSGLARGHIGDSSASDSSWTHIPQPEVNPTGCSIASIRLFCIEGE
jgi:cysteine-rich repeat protein